MPDTKYVCEHTPCAPTEGQQFWPEEKIAKGEMPEDGQVSMCEECFELFDKAENATFVKAPSAAKLQKPNLFER